MAKTSTSTALRSAASRADPTSADIDAHIGRECARLAREFDGVLDDELVRRCVEETRRRFESAKIRGFLPVLTTKYAREVLRSMAVAKRLVEKDRPEVLFVGRDDATETQIAAALLRRAAGERVIVRTAGVAPASQIPRSVRTVLREIGTEVRGLYPKPLDPRFVDSADVVVTISCGDACRAPAGRDVRNWDVVRPKRRGPDALRALRDELQTRIEALAEELVAANSPARG